MCWCRHHTCSIVQHCHAFWTCYIMKTAKKTVFIFKSGIFFRTLFDWVDGLLNASHGFRWSTVDLPGQLLVGPHDPHHSRLPPQVHRAPFYMRSISMINLSLTNSLTHWLCIHFFFITFCTHKEILITQEKKIFLYVCRITEGDENKL